MRRRIRLTESDIRYIVNKSVKRALIEEFDTQNFDIDDEQINEMGFWQWFDINAKTGWKIVVAQDGSNNNRAYNVYDENDNALGSWDECDGWESNSVF